MQLDDYVVSSDEDEVNTKRTGLPVIKNYFKKITELDKRLQLGHHKKQAPLAYLGAASQLPIVPTSLGITQHKGDDGHFDVHGQSIGDTQALAMGEAVKYSIAANLNFSDNRLTTKGVLKILQNLNQYARELNVSGN